MSTSINKSKSGYEWIPLLIGSAILFLYSSVLANLIRQWWSDDNYSHGLIVPFVIVLIIWQERDRLTRQIRQPEIVVGSAIVLIGLLMLFAGTLGAELLTQRVSLVFVIAGTVVYFFGHRILGYLSIPFLLVLLTIPIPQIVLNKLAFPLQLLATRVAHAGISLFGISSSRKGNVIDLVPYGGTTSVGIEVVEACSGIRSLITLISLAVILVYFTRTSQAATPGTVSVFFKDRDFWRGAILVILAVPIALVTNATRVLATGLATYLYGEGVTDSWWHDAFGWVTFLVGLVVLFVANSVLRTFLINPSVAGSEEIDALNCAGRSRTASYTPALILFISLLLSGALINWFQIRAETPIDRRPLAEFPVKLGEGIRPSPDRRFSPATEEVLKATDYVMRDYIEEGRRFNLYIGYYASQRTGATYHSPQNCLPGSGWEMSDGSAVEIVSPAGRRILANRYVVQNGTKRHMMIYWYQGRGRTNASEYSDKLYTIVDSVTLGRSDGSMVRVMTRVYEGENDDMAFNAATKLAGKVADVLPEFIPE